MIVSYNAPRRQKTPPAATNLHFPAIYTCFSYFQKSYLNPFGEEFWVSTRRSSPAARSRTGVLRVRGGELNNDVITQKNRQKLLLWNVQNKPNLNISKNMITKVLEMTYPKSDPEYVKKTNPIQTQYKPKQTQFYPAYSHFKNLSPADIIPSKPKFTFTRREK